jgi:hypothetical protein
MLTSLLLCRSLTRLDAWMTEEYAHIQQMPEPEKYVPSATDALYLYGRSFFLKDQPIAPQHQKAIDFFLNQSRKFWLKTNCRQTQGQLAIALARFRTFTNCEGFNARSHHEFHQGTQRDERRDGHVLA